MPGLVVPGLKRGRVVSTAVVSTGEQEESTTVVSTGEQEGVVRTVGCGGAGSRSSEDLVQGSVQVVDFFDLVSVEVEVEFVVVFGLVEVDFVVVLAPCLGSTLVRRLAGAEVVVVVEARELLVVAGMIYSYLDEKRVGIDDVR